MMLIEFPLTTRELRDMQPAKANTAPWPLDGHPLSQASRHPVKTFFQGIKNEFADLVDVLFGDQK